MTGRILIVDDDRAVVELLCEVLGPHHSVVGETDPKVAIARILAEDFDIVITDVEMPGIRGPELLAQVLAAKPNQLVLMITAFGSIELAVAAVRAGATDFITKPFKTDVLLIAIERALRERTMRREIVRLRRRLRDEDTSDLVARSPAMQRVLALAERAARSEVTVLITGESGAGKGALARWIHAHSPRGRGPLVEVNCAALPAALVEAELFGVRRGAFTDAHESRDGLFVEAAGGTLFLDEIGEMPLEVQPKLLRVLEASRARPVGAATEIELDVRLIAATNAAIDEAVAAGKFRADLFYRLDVVRIEVPPLRDRPEDVPELAQVLLARATRGAPTPSGITEEAVRWLARRDWPGNVRELANVIERAVALGEHEVLVLEDVRDQVKEPPSTDLLAAAAARHLSLDQVERGYIRKVLEACGGNVSRAARVLGIDRRTMYRKLD
ncbi:MAG: sigma-54-dependent Fis family transcriptional regulator [Myxococcales bacterium]|nr:sigma-54-dependent Fis family transcriptional regulator [Myxococcales bacterium]